MMNQIPEAIEIAEKIWQNRVSGMRRVMVALCGGAQEHQRRHAKLFRDNGGLYVRLGKSGCRKRYLQDFPGARIVDRGLNVVVFWETV